MIFALSNAINTPVLSLLFPDVTHGEGKVCGKAILLLMCHIWKKGMWPGVGCGAGWWFPDVTHEEANVRGKAILLLMLHIGKTGMWSEGGCGAGWELPDVTH